MEEWTISFVVKHPEMISSKIVKEYGYLSHNGKIIEVDDEQVMIFTKSDPGTFNMTYDERETKKMILLYQSTL